MNRYMDAYDLVSELDAAEQDWANGWPCPACQRDLTDTLNDLGLAHYEIATTPCPHCAALLVVEFFGIPGYIVDLGDFDE